ncbi:MAG: hypothetical protein KGD58_10450 [Candidatus Lokiarchaeota archaeon]|nr:hypothetical protein [Candidatus Lokiarchaeota archaeon]
MVNIRICPKCKEATLKSGFNVSGWLAPNFVECQKCGYAGYFYIEIDPEDYKLDPEDPIDPEDYKLDPEDKLSDSEEF